MCIIHVNALQSKACDNHEFIHDNFGRVHLQQLISNLGETGGTIIVPMLTLSLTHSLTCSYTLTHSLTLSLTCSYTLTQSHSLTRSFTLNHSLTYTLSLTHLLIHSHSLTHSHSITLTQSLPLSHLLTHFCKLFHGHFDEYLSLNTVILGDGGQRKPLVNSYDVTMTSS